MPRLHLLEIHEQPWCPQPVRDGATDCLNLLANLAQQYAFVAPKLRQALAAAGRNGAPIRRIVDLCSGGGGPWLTLHRRFAPPVDEIVLTDLYPNRPAMAYAARRSQGRLRGHPTPVDATQPPSTLTGFRTLFTALHHFTPPAARAILQDAVNHGQGIAVFEQTARTPVALGLMLMLPLLALLLMPFVRPWRAERLFWTYVVPAIPLVLGFDGVVSCLRTYSRQELAALIAGLEGPPYVWKIGRLPSPLSPVGVIYLIGYPQSVQAGGATGEGLPRVAATA
ncbi:MAG TPA: hypothetical protein VNK95_06320 [Caldilineaceae bacterium]|nr:hypothetical protein [Caldilineaceae bacterium]